MLARFLAHQAVQLVLQQALVRQAHQYLERLARQGSLDEVTKMVLLVVAKMIP